MERTPAHDTILHVGTPEGNIVKLPVPGLVPMIPIGTNVNVVTTARALPFGLPLGNKVTQEITAGDKTYTTSATGRHLTRLAIAYEAPTPRHTL